MFPPSRTLCFQLLRRSVRLRSFDLPQSGLNSFKSIRSNTTNTSASADSAPAVFHPWSRSIWMRRLLYVGIFGGLGLYSGQRVMSHIAAPSAPGTSADIREMKQIQETVNLLPIVRKLRQDPDFTEWEAYESLEEEDRVHRLTSGPLRGSRGLAVQRIFWNETAKEAVSVGYFGHGVDGWLSIVHGGALAAVMDECLGRVVLRSVPARTGVTANLHINYRAAVSTGDFYTVHARLDHERSTDRKAFVSGELRDPSGKVCVESTALYVVPKSLSLGQIQERF